MSKYLRMKSQQFEAWIIIIILLIQDFFTADDFPMMSKWQKVSPSLQDSSHFSDQSRHCSTLGGFHSSSYFQVKSTNTLMTVPNATIVIGITIFFRLHSFSIL